MSSSLPTNAQSYPRASSTSSPPSMQSKLEMSSETYLNHPTFGLLYRICVIEADRELFATLYAQRLFFVVQGGSGGVQFEPISRSDARVLVENRMRTLRRVGQYQEHTKLQATHKQTFQ